MVTSHVARAAVQSSSRALRHELESPEFKRFFSKLPNDIQQSLDRRQWEAIARALMPDHSPHWVDFRTSVPIPGGPGVYLALMVGRERRARARLAAEGQLSLRRNLAVAAILILTVIAIATLSILLLKGLMSVAGTDGDIWRHLIHPGH